MKKYFTLLICLFSFCAVVQAKPLPHPKPPEDPATVDTDGDGVPDVVEREHLFTDPTVCDSDGDGLGDGLEAGYSNPKATKPECRGIPPGGTNFHDPSILNPTMKDSDGDGLTDGEEDKNQNGWLDPDETDPTTDDTDGDGLDDGFESKINFDISHLNNGEGCSPPTDPNDLDCDGFINARDLDSDNDGCLDSEEGHQDRNDDGIPDVWQAEVKSCANPSTSSSPTAPSAGGAAQNKNGPEEILPSEVLPARGGGACGLLTTDYGPQTTDLKNFLCSWSVVCCPLSVVLLIILRSLRAGGSRS